MSFTPQQLEQLADVISQKLLPLEVKIEALDSKVTALDSRMTALDSRMTLVEKMQQNSRKGRDNPLVEIPRLGCVACGESRPCHPSKHSIKYPRKLACLIVSGSEIVPGETERNDWNNGSSKDLLQFYGINPEEMQELRSPVDGTKEDMLVARTRRILVAETIGVTRGQINLYSAI